MSKCYIVLCLLIISNIPSIWLETPPEEEEPGDATDAEPAEKENDPETGSSSEDGTENSTSDDDEPVTISDEVNAKITTTQPTTTLPPLPPPVSLLFYYNFNFFMSLENIYEFLKIITNKHPTAELVELGKSYEQRPIYGINIKGTGSKLTIVAGGIHGFMEIGITSTLHIIYQLTEAAKDNESLLKDTGFLIIPIINPDGHYRSQVYRVKSHKNVQSTEHDYCIGLNIDRSFEFEWGASDNITDGPCAPNYSGKKPFEAIESSVMKEVFEKYKAEIFIEFKTGSQNEILFPYAYSKTEKPENFGKHMYAAFFGVRGIKHKTRKYFQVAQYSKTNKPAGGSLMDYASASVNITYVFTVVLREYIGKNTQYAIKDLVFEGFTAVKGICEALAYPMTPGLTNLTMAHVATDIVPMDKDIKPEELTKRHNYNDEGKKVIWRTWSYEDYY